MPRGLSDSFADSMAKVLQILATAALAPDADVEFIDQIQDLIRERIGLDESSGMEADAGQAAAAMPVEAPPGGMPVTDAQVSRGPTPGMDMAGAVNELERTLAGS